MEKPLGLQKKAKKFTSPGFIVGVGRSGTSLLAAILNRHPKICVTPETHFFRLVFSYPGGVTGFQKNWPYSLREIMAQMPATKTWQPDAEKLISHFQGKFPGIRELFLALGNQIASKKRKPFWIEKTPNHINYLNEIRQFFPESPIIHIVRDGRDVALSLSRMQWASSDYLENLIRWKREVSLAYEFSKYDSLFYNLRYEDLVLNGENVVRELCQFLNVNFFPSMLEPDGSEIELIEAGHKHKELIKSKPDPSRCFVWERTLTPIRKKVSSILVEKELMLYNYSVNNSKTKFKGKLAIVMDSIWRKKWSSTVSDIVDRLVEVEKIKPLTISSLDELSNHDRIKWVLASFDIPSNIRPPGVLGQTIYVINLLKSLIIIRLKGIKIIWIYHGNSDQTTAWPFQYKLEKIIARFASIIICGCRTPELCKIKQIFYIPKEKIIHKMDNNIGTKALEKIIG